MKNFKTALFKFIFLMILSFYGLAVQAQTPAKWFFGLDVGMNFNTAPPTIFNTYNYLGSGYNNTGLGGYNVESASVAYDNSGNVVFEAIPASIGVYTVYDKNFASIGTIATTSDAAQGSLIFPRPGTANQYYLCTVDAMANVNGCSGLVGDLGNDRGANYYLVTNTGATVTLGAQQSAIASGVAECQTGVFKANATDYWWIVHMRGSADFNVFSVTNAGISLSGTYTVGPVYGSCDYVSMLAVNDCNNKIAMTINGTVNLFDFNNTTGVISNPVQWILPCAYGLEFSTNNSYLFVSTGTSSSCSSPAVYQYNISTGAVSNLGATAGGTLGKSGHLQLGPDGNIYVAQMTSNGGCSTTYVGQISTINNMPATFVNNKLTISDLPSCRMAGTMSLPTILKASITGKALLAIPNADNICVGNNNSFSYTFSGSVNSQSWALTPSTGFTYASATNSSSASPIINFTSANTYKVLISVTDNCGYNYNDSTNITVNNPINTLGSVTCPITGNVTAPNGAYTYVWFSDAALTTPIATGTSVSLPAGAGTVYVAAESGYSAGVPTTLTNAIFAGGTQPNDATSASSSLQFTVNTSLLNFTSFQWRSIDAGYSASTVSAPFIITITDASSTVYYTNTRSVVISGPTTPAGVFYTENVNVTLPPGSYTIKITGGSIRSAAGYNGCSTNMVDASGALTYNTTGTDCFVANMAYTLSNNTYTPLSCSNAGGPYIYNCPLPVSWVSFTATQITGEAAVLLHWSTATETTNTKFMIQRSSDGMNFTDLYSISGSGTTRFVHDYSFVDNAPSNGINYYRIIQYDINGQSSMSEITAVEIDDATVVQIAPNPFSGNTMITFNEEVAASIRITDVLGKIVFQYEKPASTITATVGEGLSSGTYIVQVITVDQSYNLKIVKE